MKNVQLSPFVEHIYFVSYQEVVLCENVEMKVTLKILKKKGFAEKIICVGQYLLRQILPKSCLLLFILKSSHRIKKQIKMSVFFFVSYQQRQIT